MVGNRCELQLLQHPRVDVDITDTVMVTDAEAHGVSQILQKLGEREINTHTLEGVPSGSRQRAW
jgi:hypothetical protein